MFGLIFCQRNSEWSPRTVCLDSTDCLDCPQTPHRIGGRVKTSGIGIHSTWNPPEMWGHSKDLGLVQMWLLLRSLFLEMWNIVTDGFLHYATLWGHYGLFGCLASPSGDACIYPIILLYFSKRTQLYLRVSPCIDSVRFTLVLVSSPCKVKALQILWLIYSYKSL